MTPPFTSAAIHRIEKLRIEIINIPPDGRPRRNDVVVYNNDGTIYEGVLISPSAVNSVAECERKWGWAALDGIRFEKPSAKFGTARHRELELWLLKGQPPATPLLIKSGALQHFPLPRTPGLFVEKVFAFRFDDVVFWGFKDAEYLDTVFDLKTTSDFKWAKTGEELRGDVQGNVYAVDNMLGREAKNAKLKWVYVQTKGKAISKPVDISVAWDEAVGVLGSKLHLGLRILEIRADTGITTGKQLKKEEKSCGNYGGCDYLHLCAGDGKTAGGAGSKFFGALRQENLAKQRENLNQDSQQAQLQQQDPQGDTNMASILEKAKLAAAASDPAKAAAIAQAIASAPTIPVQSAAATPTAPVRAAPVVAAPPKLGKLSGMVAAAALANAAGSAVAAAVTVTAPTVDVVAPPPPAPTVVDKKPRGRPTVKEAAAATAALLGPATDLPFGFTLYIDVLPLKGSSMPSVDEFINPARDTLEKEAEKDYRLLGYQSGGMLAAQILENFRAAPPMGTYYVHSKTTDKEVLEALMRKADVVYKGVI